MADKSTVTMWHREAAQPIEVLPAEIANARASGWTTDPPRPADPPATPPPESSPRVRRSPIKPAE